MEKFTKWDLMLLIFAVVLTHRVNRQDQEIAKLKSEVAGNNDVERD